MAYVINPDGTITTVEADYDRNGNLKPKINSELLNEQVIKYNSNSAPDERISVVKKSASIKKKSKVSRSIPPKRQQQFISTAEIDMFFRERKATNKRVSTDEYIRITDKLPKELKDYFIIKYRQHLRHGSVKVDDDDPRNRKAFKKSKSKKKAKKNKASHVVKTVTAKPSTHSGFSLGEIATFSSLNKRTPDGDMVNGRSLRGASRNPKFGYARDRFGRVQERDSFNEDLRNEFKSAQRHQNNYDYSSYDENDDHDGAYRDWE